MKKKLIITTGDPAGCGPLITLKALDALNIKDAFIIGDAPILMRYAQFARVAKKSTFIDAATPGIERVKEGVPSSVTGRASLSYLNVALTLAAKEKNCALVTAPLSKEAVQSVLPGFCGHTEFLAERLAVKQVVMMMISGRIRIVLLTRHIPLREVPSRLKTPLLRGTGLLIKSFLEKTLSVAHPRIAIASFNPHAGTHTYRGHEERTLIKIIRTCPFIEGPYPADTLFTPKMMARYDCIIALYHDQGMIPFKLLSFTKGVNVTVGLPFIRTSPAHGTAFDIMRRRQIPVHSSMRAAIEMAYRLTK